MNEIVFESRNKEYGAFLHRSQYQKYLAKALAWSVGVFVIAVITPLVVKKMGWVKEQPLIVLDTFTLMQPPSLNPDEPEKPEVPKVEEVKRPTQEDLELIAAKKEEVRDTVMTNDKKNNTDPPKNKPDSSGGKNNNNPGGTHTGPILGLNRVTRFPEFPGGEEAYAKFQMEHQEYPKSLEKDGIEGVVMIYLVVNEDGSLEQISLHKGSGYSEFDEEALRVVKLMPNFVPAMQGDLPVRVRMILPVTFKLP